MTSHSASLHTLETSPVHLVSLRSLWPPLPFQAVNSPLSSCSYAGPFSSFFPLPSISSAAVVGNGPQPSPYPPLYTTRLHAGYMAVNINSHIYDVYLLFQGGKKQVHTQRRKPWLVWPSGPSVSLQTKRQPVGFPVRAPAWVAGQVPSTGVREATMH